MPKPIRQIIASGLAEQLKHAVRTEVLTTPVALRPHIRETEIALSYMQGFVDGLAARDEPPREGHNQGV